jgi:hypothetical protein
MLKTSAHYEFKILHKRLWQRKYGSLQFMHNSRHEAKRGSSSCRSRFPC